MSDLFDGIPEMPRPSALATARDAEPLTFEDFERAVAKIRDTPCRGHSVLELYHPTVAAQLQRLVASTRAIAPSSGLRADRSDLELVDAEPFPPEDIRRAAAQLQRQARFPDPYVPAVPVAEARRIKDALFAKYPQLHVWYPRGIYPADGRSQHLPLVEPASRSCLMDIPLHEETEKERVTRALQYYEHLTIRPPMMPLSDPPWRSCPPVLVVLGRRPRDLEWRLRQRKRRRNHA